ncbi:hypothetical protein [Neobacillus sp. CF12]|uniref:hypothetical protein n=1 Tax=Neobacillus sp. CF12 TaxID=3055864 RepID=UPI0025A0B1D4|nr:hypothetical protein [Neobacillus sp. CF12]MDM5328504.1 hypothetical protein [Neobacillus sp. CF12]
MSNKIKQEMKRIEIPKGLSERSKIGILKAKKEMKNNRKGYSLTSIGIVAGLLLSVGTLSLFNNNVFSPNGTTNNQNTPIAINSDGVKIRYDWINCIQRKDLYSNKNRNRCGKCKSNYRRETWDNERNY